MLIGTNIEIGTSQERAATGQPGLVVAYAPYKKLAWGPRNKPVFTTNHMFSCLVDDLCELRSQKDTRLAVFVPAALALAQVALSIPGAWEFLKSSSADERQVLAASNIKAFMGRWQSEFGVNFKSRDNVNTIPLSINAAQLADGEQAHALTEKVFDAFDDDKLPIVYEDPKVSFSEDPAYDQRLAEQFATVLHNTRAFSTTRLISP